MVQPGAAQLLYLMGEIVAGDGGEEQRCSVGSSLQLRGHGGHGAAQ